MSFRKPISLLMLLIIVLLSLSQGLATASVEPIYDFKPVADFLSNVGASAVEEHVKYFSSLGSRVTGYPGFFNASQYIESYFRKSGIEPYLSSGYMEDYDITVPVDHGSSITLQDGTVLKAYGIWPNYVNPCPYRSPPEGDRVLYVGKGLLEDYAEKDVIGKFILMDINSKWMYRFAAMLGAKGVIYLSLSTTTRAESFLKIYSLPLNFPRLFLTEQETAVLLKALQQNPEMKIHMMSNVTWEVVQVPNVIGVVHGTDPILKQEYIAVSAYYDSWSIFPALSPGATDALGISILLELSRLLANNPPKRSIIFVALSGHYESLWGAREFVESHFDEIQTRIRMFIGMDISSGTREAGIYNRGSMYGYVSPDSLNAKYLSLTQTIFTEMLPSMRTVFGPTFGESFIEGVFNTHPAYIQSYPPIQFVPRLMDSEPFTVAAFSGGFSFFTSNDVRMYSATPYDTPDRVNFENVWPQAQFIFAVIWGLGNGQTLQGAADASTRWATDWGYTSLRITVAVWNMTTAFFDPVTKERFPDIWKDLVVHFNAYFFNPAVSGPSSLIGIPFIGEGYVGTSAIGGQMDIVAKPDEEGTVTIKGLKPYTGRGTSPAYVRAFVINSTNGKIEWAIDEGVFRAPHPQGVPPSGVVVDVPNMNRLVAIFKCGSIATFNLLHPGDLSATLSADAYNALSHGPQIRSSRLADRYYSDFMFFVESEIPIEILVWRGAQPTAVGATGNIYSALTNPTPETISHSQGGLGYAVSAGETLVLLNSPYEYASQIYLLNSWRVKTFQSRGASNPAILMYQRYAYEYMSRAEEALKDKDIEKLYGFSFAAWGYAQRSYAETFSLMMQVIATTIFFFIILIPFVFILERLLPYSSRGPRRIITFVALFAGFITMISVFHPGFSLATNTLMSIISISLTIILLPIFFFIGSEAVSSSRALRDSMLGIHAAEISRLDAVTSALGMAIQHMKKRKFRTVLTTTSIAITVFAMTAFTSFSALPVPRKEMKTNVALPYAGITIRKQPWGTIPPELWIQLKSEFMGEALTVSRSWFYPPGQPGRITFTATGTTTIHAILALTPDEESITHIWERIGLEGRWFLPNDIFVVLISKRVSESLSSDLGNPIKVGSTINIWGVDLMVVGIYDGDRLYSGGLFTQENGIVDLYGEPITPMKIEAGTEAQGVGMPHYTGDEVIIIPYELAWQLFGTGFAPWNIVMKPFNSSLTPELALALAYRLDLDLHYAEPTGQEDGLLVGNVSAIRTRGWFSAVGMETFIPPLVISALTIFNMMLANVYERRREIAVHAAVGLSPLHITSLFLSDSISHAMISTVVGYSLGIVTTSTLFRIGAYPEEFFPNFASWFVVLVALVSILVCVASSTYPAIKSSRFAAPSLERKWKMHLSMPGEADWTIPMPFVASKDEVFGIIAFIQEFLITHGTERTDIFNTLETAYEESVIDGRVLRQLKSRVALAPYDQGMRQNVIFSFLAAPDALKRDTYSITLHLQRITGFRSSWIGTNRIFIDKIRKQLLLWRVLKPQQKGQYVSKGRTEYARKSSLVGE